MGLWNAPRKEQSFELSCRPLCARCLEGDDPLFGMDQLDVAFERQRSLILRF